MKNSIVFAEILISLQYQITKEKIIQSFVYNKRDKWVKKLKDPRYLIYDKFENKIRQESLSQKLVGVIEFNKRIDNEDSVVIEYNIIDNNRIEHCNFLQTNFKLVDFIPPYPGCSFCIYKNKLDNVYFKCELKNKIYTDDLKNCKYFKQKRLFKT